MTRLERRLAAGVVLISALVISRGSPALAGDGAYYLAATHSLVTDADLDLGDDLTGSDGFPFTDEANPGRVKRDPNGRFRPAHGLAFSAGIAPVYALVTWVADALPERALDAVKWNRARAVRDLLSLSLAALAAFLAVLTLRLTNRIAPDARSPWLIAGLAFLTPPLLIAGIQPRPDIAGAICITWFALELTRDLSRPVIAAIPLALLPWLHAQFSPVALLGAVWLIRRSTIAGVLPLVSLGAAAVVNAMLFGTWLPAVSPDGVPLTIWRWLTTRLDPLLHVDAGLLWVAPFWMLAFAGVDQSDRRSVALAKWAAGAAAGLLLVAGVFTGRWPTTPGESLTPVLPVLVPLAAAGLSRLAARWSRILARVAMLAAACVALAVIVEPRRPMTEEGHGLSRLPMRGVEWVKARNGPAAQLARLGFNNDRDGFLGAVRGGHIDALRLYLDAGHNAREGLRWAVAAGQLESLRLLLSRGAGPTPEGAFALAQARELERAPFAQALLEGGATLDAADQSGETAAIAAIRAKRPAELATLIAAGANVNAAARTGETPLALAVQLDQPEAVARLLAAGADPNVASLDGWTPLMSAVRLEQTAAVQTLLAARANPNARTRMGWTPLMWAAYDGSADIVSALLAAEADPNAMSAAGQTPLIREAEGGHADVVTALLRAGADASVRVNDASARDWAVRNGHAEVVTLLSASPERPQE